MEGVSKVIFSNILALIRYYVQFCSDSLRSRSRDGQSSRDNSRGRVSEWIAPSCEGPFLCTQVLFLFNSAIPLANKGSSWPLLYQLTTFRSDRVVRRLPPTRLCPLRKHRYGNFHSPFWSHHATTFNAPRTLPPQWRTTTAEVGSNNEDGTRCAKFR